MVSRTKNKQMTEMHMECLADNIVYNNTVSIITLKVGNLLDPRTIISSDGLAN